MTALECEQQEVRRDQCDDDRSGANYEHAEACIGQSVGITVEL